MKKLVLPGRVVKDAEAGRITAGLSSLTPEKRVMADIRGYKGEWNDQNVAEVQQRAAHAVALDGDRPRHNLEAQMGKMMTGEQVKKILRSMNPDLIFIPTQGDFKRYVIKKHNPQGDEFSKLVTVTAMERGPMPEFSTLNVTKHRELDKSTGMCHDVLKLVDGNPEIRGWRTPLAMLIRQGLVTREQVDARFGLPSHDSKRWAELLGDR